MSISLHLMLELAPLAVAQGCRYHMADRQLLVGGLPSLYHPDVLVACGEKIDDDYEKNPDCWPRIYTGARPE